MCNSGTPSDERQSHIDQTPAETPGPWNPAAIVALAFGVLSWTSAPFCHLVLAAIGPAMTLLEKVLHGVNLYPAGLGVDAVLILAGWLALGLLWINLNGPVPLAGVVLGIVAIRSIRRSCPRQRGEMFAVAGLVLATLSLASSAVSLVLLRVLFGWQASP